MYTAEKRPDTVGLKHSVLYSFLSRLGARYVPFAGYEMPLQFAPGIKAEHLHTRSVASLFDVSHMGQIRITGDDAARLLERLVPGDISGLAVYSQRYTVLTRDDGGILDDLMVTRLPDGLWLVVNADRIGPDLAWLQDRLGGTCDVALQPEQALLALQGPEAARVMTELCSGAAGLTFMQAGEFQIDGVPALIHRCGYTGEDGFEVSVLNKDAERTAQRFLEQEGVQPAGLGARDSLRLEAGLCLYGADIDETTTPVEAGLGWTIARKYRDGGCAVEFPGAPLILEQLRNGTQRLRVGLRPDGRAPVRAGTVILDCAGDEVGVVTSGSFGFSAGGPVAMGYVRDDCAATGTVHHAVNRGHRQVLHVVPLPFVAHRYHGLKH